MSKWVPQTPAIAYMHCLASPTMRWCKTFLQITLLPAHKSTLRLQERCFDTATTTFSRTVANEVQLKASRRGSLIVGRHAYPRLVFKDIITLEGSINLKYPWGSLKLISKRPYSASGGSCQPSVIDSTTSEQSTTSPLLNPRGHLVDTVIDIGENSFFSPPTLSIDNS